MEDNKKSPPKIGGFVFCNVRKYYLNLNHFKTNKELG